MGFRIPVTKEQTHVAQNAPAESLQSREPATPIKVDELLAGKQPEVGRQIAQEPIQSTDEPDDSSYSSAVNFAVGKSDEAPVAPTEDSYEKAIAFAVKKPVDTLRPAKILSRNVDLAQGQNVLDIAEKLNITPAEASARLSTTPAEELKAIPALVNIERDYPGIATWARNPERYKVLLKDPVYLKKVEETTKRINEKNMSSFEKYRKDAYKSLAGGTYSGVLKPGAGSLSFLAAMANLPGNLMRDELGIPRATPEIKLTPELAQGEKLMVDFYNEKASNYGIEGLNPDVWDSIAENVSRKDYVKAGRDISLIMLQNAPANAMALAGRFVGLSGPALISMGFLQGSGTYKESKEKGASETASTLNGLFAGTVESALEKVELHGIMSYWEKFLTKKVGKAAAKKTVIEAAKAVGASFLTEGSTESMTSFLQDFSSFATGVDPKAMEGSGKRAAGSFLLGGLTGATMSSPGALANVYIQKKNMQRITESVKAVVAADNARKMREDKKGSEVPKAHPQQTAELVDQVGQETPPPIPDDAEDIAPPRAAFVEFNISEFEEEAQKMGRDPLDVAEELGPAALAAYTKSKDNDATGFQMSVADYHRYADDLPELDDIFYANAGIQNARKGEEHLKQAQKEFELPMSAKKDLPVSEERDDALPPAIPGEEADNGPATFFEDGTPQEGDPVLRHIQLLQQGRSQEEKKVFRQLKTSITKSTKEAGINPELADLMAEFQFRNTRFRAEQLGLPISEVAEQTKVGFKKKMKDPRTKAFFQPGTGGVGMPRNKVVFGVNTTANTLIHEFTHSWLANMVNDWHFISGLETRTETQQEYFEVMEAAAKKFGLANIADLYNVSEHEYERIQETFARTGEKYFLEGNFGDSKIKKIFESMRKWMAQAASIIIDSFRRYPPLKISPEVSRIFQTILDGNRAVDENMTKMFPDELPFNEDILGAFADRYKQAKADARDQAVAQMHSKFYNRSNKEREAAILKAQNEIYDRAVLEVENMDSIKLMRMIQSSEENRITYQSIVDVLALGDKELAKQIRDMVPPKTIAGQKKQGIHISEVMQFMKINDRQKMMDVLREMGERDAIIDNLSNTMIDNEFPIMKTDEEIHKEAEAAINNQGREKLIALEAEILAAASLSTFQKINSKIALPPQRIARKSAEVIKFQAINMVMNAKALTFRAKDFMNASTRAASAAAEHVKNSEFDKALKEKQDEAVNYQAYKEGLVQAARISKTFKRMKRFSETQPKEFARRYDQDIFEYGRLMVNAMAAGKGLPEMDPSDFDNKGLLDASRVENINAKIRAVNNSLIGIQGKDITVEAFNTFGEALALVQHAASETRTIELAGRRMEVAIAGVIIHDELMDEKKDNDPKTPMTKRGVEAVSSSLKNVRTLFAGTMGEEKWANSMLAKLLRKVEDAQARFHIEKNIDDKAIADAVAAITKNNPEMQGILAPVIKRFSRLAGRDTGVPVHASLMKHTFKNKGEVLMMMLYMGSESGRMKFAKGGMAREDGSFTGAIGSENLETGEFETPAIDAQIQEFMKDGTITREDMELAKTIWSILGRHYEEVRKSVRHVDGYEIGFIEPRKISTPWGDYDGGYFPLSRDAAYIDTTQKVSEFVTDNPGTPVRELFPFTSTSMTKEREDSYYPLNMNLASLKSQLGAVYRVAYLRPAMFDVGKILDTSSFRTAIEARRPGAMQAMIKPWFKETMAQKYSQISEEKGADAIDRTVRYFRKSMRIKAFFWNHVTFMTQYLGLFPALNKLDARLMARAAAEVGVNPGKAVERIAALSDRMAVRFYSNQQNAVKTFEEFLIYKDWINMTDEQIERMTYAPIQWAQNHVDVIIFYAAMEQAKKLGLTEEADIVGYAADVVESTQMTSNISSRPSIMRGSETKKMISDFMSVPLAMYGLVSEAQSRNLDESKIKKAKVMSFVLLSAAIIPSIAGTMISNPGKLLRAVGGDEDEEDYMKDMASDVASDILDVRIPVFGKLAWHLYRDDVSRAFPVIQASKAMGKAARAGISMINPYDEKDEITPADFRAMLTSITMTTHIPLSVLDRGFKVLTDINPDLDPDR